MFRVLGSFVVLFLLAAVVVSGVKHGFTALHFKMAIPLAALAVIALVPTRKPARQNVRVR